MTPIPGFAKFNYELGFGDVRLEPVWETLRICTWHEKTALVLCNAVDEHARELVDVVPRYVLETLYVYSESCHGGPVLKRLYVYCG